MKEPTIHATMVAMLPFSTISQQPISSWIHGSIPISNLTSSPSFKSRRLTLLNSQFRAALVEAKPSSQSSVSSSASPKDDPLKALALSKDRAEDIQAEAKALARAVNASVYSPQLVASRYGSKPLKVL